MVEKSKRNKEKSKRDVVAKSKAAKRRSTESWLPVRNVLVHRIKLMREDLSFHKWSVAPLSMIGMSEDVFGMFVVVTAKQDS